MRRALDVPMKKPYKAPKLIVYGDLTQLTMTGNKGVNPDKAGKSKT